jgi:hypothetical protein
MISARGIHSHRSSRRLEKIIFRNYSKGNPIFGQHWENIHSVRQFTFLWLRSSKLVQILFTTQKDWRLFDHRITNTSRLDCNCHHRSHRRWHTSIWKKIEKRILTSGRRRIRWIYACCSWSTIQYRLVDPLARASTWWRFIVCFNDLHERLPVRLILCKINSFVSLVYPR